MDKKNNWLKLKVDFFSTPALKKLRKIAGGDTYLIIYQKLMLLTVNTEGHYKYENIEPTLEEELALIIDEDVDNVKMTLSFLKSSKLAENLEDFIFFPALSNLIGKNDNSTERVAKYREKKKLQSKCNALHFVTCNESNDDVTVTCNNVTALEKEKEKEKEKDKDKEKEKEKNIKKEKSTFVIPNNFIENEKEAIKDFIEHRKFIKSPLSSHAFNIFINRLNNFKTKNYDIIEIINNAIVSGWKTVYEPKPIKQSTKPTPKSIQEWLHNCNDNFVASEDF